jgi:tetratricopeptide (TPR) repeat protein
MDDITILGGAGMTHYDESEREITKEDVRFLVIQHEPKNVSAYFYRGNGYKDKKDLDQAIADCSQAIKLDPNSTIAYINRGVAFEIKGDYDLAIVDFSQVIELTNLYKSIST